MHACVCPCSCVCAHTPHTLNFDKSRQTKPLGIYYCYPSGSTNFLLPWYHTYFPDEDTAPRHRGDAGSWTLLLGGEASSGLAQYLKQNKIRDSKAWDGCEKMKRGCQGGLGREQHVSGYSRVLGGHVRCAKGKQGDTAAGQAKGSDGQVVALKASIEDLTVGGVTHSLLLLLWLLCAGPSARPVRQHFKWVWERSGWRCGQSGSSSAHPGNTKSKLADATHKMK